MPRKKAAETTEETTGAETASAEDASAEAQSADATETTEGKPKQASKEKDENAGDEAASEDSSILSSVINTVTAAASTVAETVAGVASTVTDAIGITGGDTETVEKGNGKRAQRIGVVTSDKMTKTVVVRVDRLIKHPKYRRYVRRKKQFMAHDETGATIGDKVRIIETRPLSARKRWRVVEIVQKAAK